MISKSFAIDFIREIIYRELELKHLEDSTYIGGENDVSLFSFYEQLKNQEQVNRYVERFRDLTDQANRSSLIANGVILAPENPTITNLYSSLIVPLTFQTTFRSTLANRDLVVKAMHYLFDKLKGTSVNVAELENGSLFYLRKIGNHKENIAESGAMMLPENGIYLGKNVINGSTDTYTNRSIISTRNYALYSSLTKDIWYCLGKVSDITTKLSSLSPNNAGNLIDLQLGYYQDDYFNVKITNSQNFFDEFGELAVGPRLIFNSTAISTYERQATDEPDLEIDHFAFSGNSTKYVWVKISNGTTLDEYKYQENSFAKLIIGYAVLLDDISLKIYKTFFKDNYYYDEGSIAEDKWVDLFPDYVYYMFQDHLKVAIKDTDHFSNKEYLYRPYDETTDSELPIVLPPTEKVDDLYKVSISFDSERVETPLTLNGEETCVVSFGGSATLCDKNTKLGNDLVQITMIPYKIVIGDSNDFYYDVEPSYLEPLELPSGNNVGTEMNQLLSNKFVNNSHASSISPSLQYTFICNESIALLETLYDYARYGINDVNDGNVSPNTIYKITETWSANGVVKNREYLGKIVESIDIENNESDVLTITLPIQLQGENN